MTEVERVYLTNALDQLDGLRYVMENMRHHPEPYVMRWVDSVERALRLLDTEGRKRDGD